MIICCLELSYTNNFHTSIRPINGAQTGATAPGKNRTGSNSNEAYFIFPKSPKLAPYHQIQFSVILRTLFFMRS